MFWKALILSLYAQYKDKKEQTRLTSTGRIQSRMEQARAKQTLC